MRKVIDFKALAKLIADESPVIDRIYLFGSRVRGEEREGSDVDLALIIRGEIDWETRRALLNRLYLSTARNGIPVEFHLKSTAAFEAERTIPGLSKTIMQEGTLLWTRN